MSISDAFSIVSSSAVVVTLALLYFQMRQTNRNQRAILQQGRSARMSEAIALRAQAHLGEAWDKGLNGDLTLDGSQIQALYAWSLACFYNLEDLFLQHKAGLLPPGSWDSDVAAVRTLLTIPFVRVTWKAYRMSMEAEFTAYVDELVRDTKPRKFGNQAQFWTKAMEEEMAKAV